jgi:membrane associated rhomboid family serine protease
MSITVLLILVTCVISFWAFNNQEVFYKLKHYPYLELKNKEFGRLVTSGFVHGDFLHLFLNMFVLYEFGSLVENFFTASFGNELGKPIFLVAYLLMICAGDIPTMFKYRDNQRFSSVGASGAVSGIVFMFILLNPWSMLGIFGIIPIPAVLFGVLYIWYSTWAARNNPGFIDHEAHIYGALSGIILLIIIQPEVVKAFIEKLIYGIPF